jgi:hypothetical protein
VRLALVSVCLVMLASTALADPRQRATELMGVGNTLYRAGDFAGALQQYRAARDLLPSYRLDFNIGMTLAKLGRDTEAAAELERFLRDVADVAEPEMVGRAKLTLTELQARVGRLGVICPVADAEVLVDGTAVGRTPVAGWIYLRPAQHTLVVRAPGRQDFTHTLVLYPGDHPRVSVSLPAIAAAAPPEERPPRRRSVPVYRRWWFWTAIGAVVIGGAVAGGVAGYYYTRPVPSGELGGFRL